MDSFWIFLIEGLVISVVGSVLHFTYEWCHENKFVAMFAAVNESTWEHIKLALSGIFLCTLGDVWFLGSNPNYWFARSISFLVPVLVIPVLFYGYQIFTKHSILPVDITIFIIASFLSSLTLVLILDARPIGAAGEVVSIVISMIIIASYLLLTRFPLHHNFLFEDPITHQYGYEGHSKVRAKKRDKRGKAKKK